jgi:hypothetical protein
MVIQSSYCSNKLCFSFILLFIYVITISSINDKESSAERFDVDNLINRAKGQYLKGINSSQDIDKSLTNSSLSAGNALGTMIALFAELYQDNIHWISSTPNSGYYITSKEMLEERVNKSKHIRINKHSHQVQSSKSCYSDDCIYNNHCMKDTINITKDTILYLCAISAYDAQTLQEWLLWQLIVVGFDHIILYLNKPHADHSFLVIQPFVDAGYVTVYNATGANQQPVVYTKCMTLIREKSCYYSGRGTLYDVPNCKGKDYDYYYGVNPPKPRVAWLAGFDTDEYPWSEDFQCFPDILVNYEQFNGLMLPWYIFEHGGRFSPTDSLYPDSYVYRKARAGNACVLFLLFFLLYL